MITKSPGDKKKLKDTSNIPHVDEGIDVDNYELPDNQSNDDHFSEDDDFVDMMEIDQPVEINLSQSNTISDVDSIQYIDSDGTNPNIITKIKLDKTGNTNSSYDNYFNKSLGKFPSINVEHITEEKLFEEEKPLQETEAPLFKENILPDDTTEKTTGLFNGNILDDDKNTSETKAVSSPIPPIETKKEDIPIEEPQNELELSTTPPPTEELKKSIIQETVEKAEKDIEPETPEEIDNLEEVDELDTLDEVEELEELGSEEDTKIDELIDNINTDNDEVKYPGKIELEDIDKTLLPKKTGTPSVTSETESGDELFGVNRVEVFYNIDKQIYSSRSSSMITIDKIKKLKKGLFLPTTVAISSFVVLFIVITILSIYFRAGSTSTLEDNVINDNSIFAKIAEQQKEEARLASLKLEEERQKLEEEKRRMESTINEELLKKEAEIQQEYLEQMNLLKSQGMSKEEIEKIKKQYEEQRLEALRLAREEKNKRINEQNKLLAEKDKELLQAMDTLKKESEASKQQEIEKIKKEYEARNREETKKIEEARLKLQEIRENEDKIKSFNETIYQFIISSMSNFKNKEYDAAMEKLNAVLKYYNSRQDFVAQNTELQNKMKTDIFFVESIKNLIDETKTSTSYNQEYSTIINKFKLLTEYYKNAETYYTNKNFEQSSREYEKVLEEFDEVNTAYAKIKTIEQQNQEILAGEIYNTALSNIENKQYDIALKQLTSLLLETPTTRYTSEALTKIITIKEELAAKGKVEKNNLEAKLAFDKAQALEKEGKLDDARKQYGFVITNYQYSDYTIQAYNASNKLLQILNQNEFSKYKQELVNKFNKYYSQYVEYNNKGDYKTARQYYFQALNNAFEIYTNNSIEGFEELENNYIASLLETAEDDLLREYSNKEENLSGDFAAKIKEYDAKLTDYENRILEYTNKITEYETQIVDYDKRISEYGAQIEDYKTKFTQLNTKITEQDDTKISDYEKKISDYEGKISDYEGQISGYQEKISDFEGRISGYEGKISTYEGTITDYESRLNDMKIELENLGKEKEDLIKKYEILYEKNLEAGNKKSRETLKKYEKDLAQKDQEMEKLRAYIAEIEKAQSEDEANKLLKAYEAELGKEREKYEILKQQLYEYYEKDTVYIQQKEKTQILEKQIAELQKQYEILQQKYKDSSLTPEEKEAIEKQIKEMYEKEYALQKEKEIEEARQKIREEFEEELDKMKQYIASLNAEMINKDIEESKTFKNQYFGRITDIINDAVAFEFIVMDNSEFLLKKGDKVQIIHLAVENGGRKEILTGYMQITSVKPGSLYGRGRIISYVKGYTAQIGDLLKN